MNALKTILLVEDDPNDVELTLEALAEYRVANEVMVLHDGAEALDYLYRRGRFEDRAGGAGGRVAGPEDAEGGRIRRPESHQGRPRA